jgi:hypothetical protein
MSEDSGEVVYTVRLAEPMFTPRVFEIGTYSVHVGEPGTANVQTFSGLVATPQPTGKLDVAFQ